jgi:hypothetical protein
VDWAPWRQAPSRCTGLSRNAHGDQRHHRHRDVVELMVRDPIWSPNSAKVLAPLTACVQVRGCGSKTLRSWLLHPTSPLISGTFRPSAIVDQVKELFGDARDPNRYWRSSWRCPILRPAAGQPWAEAGS